MLFPFTQLGKACLTKFTRLHFNGRTSILRCEPETGRTHQIRVHLQHLGFPIANDPIYTRSEINTISLNPTALEGEDFPEGCESLGLTAGVQGAATKTTATSNTTSHVLSSRLKETTGGQERKDADGEGDEESSGVSNISLTTSVAPDHETHLQEVEGGCSDCKLTRMDPLPEQLYIYLHAYKYVGQGWSYQTEMPFWAREDYDDSFLPERFWRHNGKWDGKVLGEVLEE